MKVILPLLFSFFSFSTLFSQNNQWTWTGGNDYIAQYAIYGIKGIAAAGNKPGGRQYAAEWTDASGNLWLFGGNGYTDGRIGYLNDLWRYNVSTGEWTWINGDKIPDLPGVYGAKGTAASANKPGARRSAVTWTDDAGNLWLFGGYGYASLNSGYLNDLWKYMPSTGQWTWMGGDDTPNLTGVYKTKGKTDPANKPGPRQNAVSWKDTSGTMWLFGGRVYDIFSTQYLNDLWKYIPSTGQWTWISGDTTGNQWGIYGTAGTAAPSNKPGGRESAISWADGSGDLWLWGGSGNATAYYNGYLNDLWKYNPATDQWTWMSGDNISNQSGVYGTQGIAAPSNKPGAAQNAVSWKDTTGNLWLFGGNGNGIGGAGSRNDLWKYTLSTGQWTWVKGLAIETPGIYGAMGTADPVNTPGSRYGASSWTGASGDLWLFGGWAYTSNIKGFTNDLWKYMPSTGQWTWASGDNDLGIPGIYGTQGAPAAANQPGSRREALSWTDASGDLWLFGGEGYSMNGVGILNDLWKYTTATQQWTWVNGSGSPYAAAIYNTKGVGSSVTNPGARVCSVSWRDADGNLWMFGGKSNQDAAPAMYLNDLWKYAPSTNRWIWMSGDNLANQYGFYGTKNTAATANKPGARLFATTWTTASGDFWLFGGTGYAASGSPGNLNDLWKYTPLTGLWMWIGGDSTIGQTGNYGTQGMGSPGVKPGARSGASGWIDASGNLWLFGGTGLAASSPGYLNDLWKYSTAIGQWKWASGDSIPRQLSVADSSGATLPGNKPGSRTTALSWMDTAGNLWLFGGEGYRTDKNFIEPLGDVWMYTPSTGLWTWKSYNAPSPYLGIYGIKGTAGGANNPGARFQAVSWTDPAGSLLMFGGYGFALNGYGYLNDLWKYSPANVSLPVRLGSFGAQKQQQTVLLNWTTIQELNSCCFTIARSSDGYRYDSIGQVAAAGTSSVATNYSFIDKTPRTGTNFYRLKQLDQDGKFMYSAIVNVTVDQEAGGFAVVQNPVSGTLQLRVQQPAGLKLTLQVRDMNGHLLISEERMGNQGSNTHTLIVERLSRGTYLITVKTGGVSSTKTFIKE